VPAVPFSRRPQVPRRPIHFGARSRASLLLPSLQALDSAVATLLARYPRLVGAMAPPRAASIYSIACPFCCMSFRRTSNSARLVQTTHKNESRCAAAAAAAAAVSHSFKYGSMAAMASASGPPLLDDGATAADDAVVPSPEVNREGVTHAGAAQHVVLGATSAVASDAAFDGDSVNVAAAVGSSQSHKAEDHCDVLVGESLFDTDDEEDVVGAAEDGSTIGAAASDLLAALPHHVFLSSTAARIRAYYLAFPETSRSTPVVPASWASRPTRFCSPALRGALRFASTAGGCGLTERDHVAYAQSLCAAEQEATRGTSLVGPVSAAFPSAHGFLTATRHEQNRVLATRGWMEVTIEIGGRSYLFSLDALAGAQNVSFGRARPAGGGVAADDLDGYEIIRRPRASRDARLRHIRQRVPRSAAHSWRRRARPGDSAPR